MQDASMTTNRKSLFMFLMGLAWKCRFSMPLLLSGSAAVLGRAWMFQVRVRTVHGLRGRELGYYDDDDEAEDDSWETDTNDSWETIMEEEVSYG